MDDEDLVLVLPTRKPPKRRPKPVPEDPSIAAEAAAFELGRMNIIDAKKDWPDYTYEELLGIAFGIIRDKYPDLGGDKKKFVMKPPQVARAGSKKTAFTNYAEICKLLKRQPKHVLQFLLAELGTTYDFIHHI
uniref:Eukaryotic translation initiation factor 2 subunit 2 n=1 Tax=Panagrolaimus superbus TaxID=310955 RepID=A0A914YMJ6_9BILA